MKLIEKLNLLIKERGITKTDLARESGVPYTTIMSLYDKGYENVKLSTLKKLAQYFGVSLGYLCGEDGDINNLRKQKKVLTLYAD